jgi:hypothetical protein
VVVLLLGVAKGVIGERVAWLVLEVLLLRL